MTQKRKKTSGAYARAVAKKAGTVRKRGGPQRRKTPLGSKSPETPRPVKPFRLAPDVRPSEVDVHVDVDPSRSQRFQGEVAIELELERGRRKIELHAADLRITRPRLIVDDRTVRGRAVLHPDRQTVVIEFGETVPPGRARLELGFAGKLRTDLCGLYGAQVGKHRFAFTQLEAADARKFFPCFDEPGMKARWKLSVTTGRANEVVGNARVRRTTQHPKGQKTVEFERTPTLSSYLVALAVGPLERSRPVRAGETEIRLWRVPGKKGMDRFALECAQQTLLRLEEYFALPYPYDKLDLVAVPDFEFGAMENAGAVFFRETLLLIDPRTVTLAEKKRAAEVICHELAHMWYGNLVTMSWWDDLWLNEAFATWMAFQIVDAWQPEWKMWHAFHHHRVGALDLDALQHTHPIYTPVRTPDEANENFDVITYEKGASVVRMLERYLGPARFRKGVRLYIRRHAEANAVAADLWSALSEVSNQDIEAIARSWIEQEGYPVVDIRRKRRRGRDGIELRQDRFFEHPLRASSPREPVLWPVPWVGRTGNGKRTRQVRHLLRKQRDWIETPSPFGFVQGNADEGGFFRPCYGPNEFDDLLRNLGGLSPAERMGWVDHQWALTRAGRAEISSMLDLAECLTSETDPDVLSSLARPLHSLASRLAPDVSAACEDRLRRWVASGFTAPFEKLGFAAKRDEPESVRVQRAATLDLVGKIGNEPRVVAEAEERCQRYLRSRASLEPNLADGVVSIAATVGDARLHRAFQKASRDARTPQERLRFLLALCDFSDPALISQTQALLLRDAVPTQDVAFVLVRLLQNRAAQQSTWDFLREEWPTLRERIGSLLASRVIGATAALRSRTHRAEVARFFRANPVPAGARTLRQALERFDAYAAFRKRQGRALDDDLRNRAPVGC